MISPKSFRPDLNLLGLFMANSTQEECEKVDWLRYRTYLGMPRQPTWGYDSARGKPLDRHTTDLPRHAASTYMSS